MKISIAIPDSTLKNEPTQLDKSRKISEIARACAIFQIDTIYIYQQGGTKQDYSILVTILKYLDTPPFMRKKTFSQINELKYAGVLHPLQIPSHISNSDSKKIKAGDTRAGIVISQKGKRFVDIGVNQFIPYYGKQKVGRRIILQFKKGYPDLSIKEITKEEISEYWGFNVKDRTNLFDFLSSWSGNIIMTSRKGKKITKSTLEDFLNQTKPILVVFGSTDKGLYEILGNRIKSVQNSKIFNFFPNQATETIRIEEAIIGTLSILNAYSKYN